MKQSMTAVLVTVALAGCSANAPPPSSSIDAAKSVVVLSPSGPVVADGTQSVTVSVTVNDADGKPLAQVPVAVSLSGAGGNVGQAANTGADGKTSAMLGSTLAETKTITVTAGSSSPVTLATSPTVNFVGGPVSNLQFAVAPPSTVRAGEIITPAVVVTLLDNHDNPAAADSSTVQLRLVRSSSNGTLSGGSAKPAVDGGVIFDALAINRPQAGYALRAEVLSGPATGAAAESPLFEVTLGPVAMATSSLTASPANVVADGVATSTLTLTLHDLGDNAVSGQAVSLSVSGTGNTLGASSGASDGSGKFTTTLASTVQEAKTVTATVGTLTFTAQVVFIP